MRKSLILGAIVILLSSCASMGVPEFRGTEGMKMNSLEGKKISFTAGVKMFNPNWFGVKIKKSHVEVFVEEQLMGVVYLDKKVKLKAKQESTLIFPLLAELQDGSMLTLLKYSNKENVNVRIKGKVKGGVWIFSKKMEIDQTRVVSGKDLRLGFGKN
jgi:LEA14-like dessication related protein